MSAAASQPVFEESFGRRLRRERERRQIPLSSIATNTKIAAALFEDLERDDVSKWPSGIFRRSFIRSYARAVGLDPDTIAQEFVERFPDPNDPDTQISPEIANPPSAPSSLRLTLAVDALLTPERLLGTACERAAAVACDLAVVAVIGLAMYAVLGSFWMPLCLTLAGYYAGGVLLLRGTPGVCLCTPRRRKTGASLTAVSQLVRKQLGKRRPSRLREVVDQRVRATVTGTH